MFDPISFASNNPGPIADSTEAFLGQGPWAVPGLQRLAGGPRWRRDHGVVVCAGDSNTRAMAAADYLPALRRRHPQLDFVRAGVNGNLAYNVAQRLDQIIACQPDVVTLLVGTNDVNALFDSNWDRRYRTEQKLPRRPDLDWYLSNVTEILDRLAQETTARVAVLEIPILGEDLGSRMNVTVDKYNEGLRQVAAERDVPCLPLHQRMVSMLDPAATPPPYAGSRIPMIGATALRTVLRRSWDQAGQAFGLALLTDHVHINDTAAAVVAELIGDFLDSLDLDANRVTAGLEASRPA